MSSASIIVAAIRLSSVDSVLLKTMQAQALQHDKIYSRTVGTVHAGNVKTSRKRRLRSALAWCCLVYLARESFSCQRFPGQVTFSPTGKPLHPSLHFSLSHSVDTVVVAMSQVAAVGVDVEDLENATQLPAQRGYCAANERLPAGLAPLDIWTRKEAVIKAAGAGLDAMRQVSLDDHGARFAQRHWSVVSLTLPWPCSCHLASTEAMPLTLLLPEPATLLAAQVGPPSLLG
mgnify:CR=1 FL=1